MTVIDDSERIPDFDDLGVTAFTTTRQVGSFGMLTDEPVGRVSARWRALRTDLRPYGERFATISQVHGTTVVVHGGGWSGWLREDDADGHLTAEAGLGLAVTVADCVPVFLAHPDGILGILHAGWRGTANRIVDRALDAIDRDGHRLSQLRAHLGPAICGDCYEVGPDVYEQLTGISTTEPRRVDLRERLARQLEARKVSAITFSRWCTRCNNDRFFSHRAGDAERQLGVIIARR